MTERDARIIDLFLAGHKVREIAVIERMFKNTVSSTLHRLRSKGAVLPLRLPGEPVIPRIMHRLVPPVEVAAPKPPPAPHARRGATCQWVLSKGRMCDQPATAFRPDGSVAREGAVYCPEHRARVFVPRRTAPAQPAEFQFGWAAP
jgi:hypothetical protein